MRLLCCFAAASTGCQVQTVRKRRAAEFCCAAGIVLLCLVIKQSQLCTDSAAVASCQQLLLWHVPAAVLA